ncbi:sirohydrochlorin cobaltochelatase [Lachnospiraceae bacterium 38-10]
MWTEMAYDRSGRSGRCISGCASADPDQGRARKNLLILLAGIGDSGQESSDPDIAAIEEAVKRTFPVFQVRRVCTGGSGNDLEKTLEQAARDGTGQVIVQPFYLLRGHKYAELIHTLKRQEHLFEKVLAGAPFLSEAADMDEAVRALYRRTAEYDDGETALCFLGHGTPTGANRAYGRLQERFAAAGYENCHVAVIKNTPSLEEVMALWEKKKKYKRVVLRPLMVAAGTHVKKDMAGERNDSARSILERAGYEVLCIVEGLGRLPEIQDIYVRHIEAALAKF